MPMYYDQIDQELDAVDERGAGRVPQEMAKSDYYGSHAPAHPRGISLGLLLHKIAKTLRGAGAEYTQVTRQERK